MIGFCDTNQNDKDDSFTSSPDTTVTITGFLTKYCFELPLAITTLTDTKRMVPLDQSFQPGTYDVVCGRGKGSYNRPGNKRFRSLVATYIPKYLKARSKMDKSMVLNDIIDKVRSFINPDTGAPAQFVKFTKTAGWVLIGDEHAREKVGHAIREAIAAHESPSCSHESTASSSSASPSPTLELESSTSLSAQCDEIFSQQNSYYNHLRTVHQRSSLTSLDMQAAVDALLVGV